MWLGFTYPAYQICVITKHVHSFLVDAFDARMHGKGMLFLLHESSLHDEVVPHFVEGKSEVPLGSRDAVDCVT